MMKRLAKHNRILFVDPPVAYSNLIISPSLLENHFKKTLLWLRGVREVEGNLYVYYPPPLLLQYGHLKFADIFNQTFTTYAIKKAAYRSGFKNPIVWTYHPYAINPNGQFNEKLVCYDCNDDVGFFFSQHFNKRKKLLNMEESLTKKADIVFATSKYLYNLRKAKNSNTYYLPSAINIGKSHFSELKGAAEMEAFSKPIIGFVGGITNIKINWEWIKEAAQSNPQWNFVFIGPLTTYPPTAITDQKNIAFLGAKLQEELPAYIKSFDVCLIPYKGEEFLKACQPTKAFEYLAVGKPVVSSWIPELEDYQDIIYLSRNAKEFIKNIEIALTVGKNKEMIELYIKTSQGYTWEDRVTKASELITGILDSRKAN